MPRRGILGGVADKTRHPKKGGGADGRQARTEVRQRQFLAAFVALGNVSAAARRSGVARCTVYAWLDADPAFATSFIDAKEEAADTLEFEARRRAVDGVERPAFHAGRQVSFVREYSDTLLIFLLKAAKPEKYAHRHVCAVHPLENIVAGATPRV